MLAGDAVAAERAYRAGFRIYEINSQAWPPEIAAELSHVMCAQGRNDEALALTELAQSARFEDVPSSVNWRRARAKVFARRSQFDEAEQLAREAVGLVEETDMINLHGDALMDLAEVISVGDRQDEATCLITEARHLYELKGNLVCVGRACALLSGDG